MKLYKCLIVVAAIALGIAPVIAQNPDPPFGCRVVGDPKMCEAGTGCVGCENLNAPNPPINYADCKCI